MGGRAAASSEDGDDDEAGDIAGLDSRPGGRTSTKQLCCFEAVVAVGKGIEWSTE